MVARSPSEPAWVVVAPPNYAPQLKSVRTMYDLIEDRNTPSSLPGYPGTVSFTKHILPIFERMCGLQWVNAGFAEEFGWRAPHDFLRPDFIARLATLSAEGSRPRPSTSSRSSANRLSTASATTRRTTAGAGSGRGATATPWTSIIRSTATSRLATCSSRGSRMWAENAFEADYDPDEEFPKTIDDVPLAEQPAMLTEASLSFCLADAFHPGCEIGLDRPGAFIFGWLASGSGRGPSRSPSPTTATSSGRRSRSPPAGP